MLSELALTSLALSLATNPTPQSVSIYNQLSIHDQAKIEMMVNHQDLLPQKIEELISRSQVEKSGAGQPTSETSSPGDAVVAEQPCHETSGTTHFGSDDSISDL